MTRSSQVGFGVWLLLALTMTVVTAGLMYRGLPVETDLLALLPADERSPSVAAAIEAFQGRVGERTLVLVGAATPEQLAPAVDQVCESLRASEAFAQVQCRRSVDPAQVFELISSYRWQLLSTEAAAQLQAGQWQAFFDDVQAHLFSPMGVGRAALLLRDPLGLTATFLSTLEQPGVSVDPDTGIAWVEGEGRRFGIIDARNRHGAFDDQGPEHLVQAYEAAAERVARTFAGTQVLGIGIAFHAAAASKVAKQEMSTIGLGSWVGSILLVLFVFRTLRSLLVSSLIIALAMQAGLLATLAVFGQVHVLTLVLGSTLAGVAIDYAIHVLADTFREPATWQAEPAVRRLRWPLFLGMATSVAAYGSLALTPFPGLRQLALFASVALVTAFGSVVLSFPLLLRGYRAWGSRPRELAQSVLAFIDRHLARPKVRWALLIGVCAPVLLGLGRVRTEDDVHTFQNPDPLTTAREQRARALFSMAPESQFFVVLGHDEQEVLEREEGLRVALQPLVARGVLGHFQMVSDHVPSRATQARNVSLLATQVYSAKVLDGFLHELGFTDEAIEHERSAFRATANQFLSVDQWLRTAPGEADRAGWLGETSPGVFSSVVLLHSLTDPSALAKLTREGVVFVDRANDISTVMARSRRWALALVAVAFVTMWLMLTLRYGARGAAQTLMPTALACAVALATFGWLGLPLNIFSTVALWLVVGMGVDYSIFFREASDDASSTTVGIFADSMTTLLSFGLLSFSATPALRSFGLVLLIGLTCALLAAPFARRFNSSL